MSSPSAFITFNIFYHSTFCTNRHFLLFLFGVLSPSTFCPFDVFYHSTFCHSVYCPIQRFVLRRFLLLAFYTSTFCWWTDGWTYLCKQVIPHWAYILMKANRKRSCQFLCFCPENAKSPTLENYILPDILSPTYLSCMSVLFETLYGVVIFKFYFIFTIVPPFSVFTFSSFWYTYF